MIPAGCYIVDDDRTGKTTPAVAHVFDNGHGILFMVFPLGEGAESIRIEDDHPSYVGEDGYYVLPTGDGQITLRWPDVNLFDELAPEFPEMAWPEVQNEGMVQAFLCSMTIDVYPGP